MLTGVSNLPSTLLQLQHGQGAFVKLKDGTQFNVCTLMDMWIIKETCLDKAYERDGVAIRDGWTVVDIGASLGDFAISVARSYPNSVVYAYEPFPTSFALLNDNQKRNGLTNVKAFPYAVGSSDGEVTLDVSSFSHAVQHSTATGQEGLRVKSVSLATVIAQLGERCCSLLKMDCEGAEFDILLNAAPSTLDCIDHISMEVHDGITQFTHADLSRHLEANGFAVKTLPNPVHANLGFLYARNMRA